MYVGGGRLLSGVSVRGRSSCGELVESFNNAVEASDGVGEEFVAGRNVSRGVVVVLFWSAML